MKYNAKYDRYFTKGGLVYRYDSKQDKLVLIEPRNHTNGYKQTHYPKHKTFYVHRAVYETFVGEIPVGYEIDHINTIRDDNRLENLRAVTHLENVNNPLTRNRKRTSEFGKKYFEHFGYSCSKNTKQYHKELMWYSRHGKCRWM